MRDAYFGGRTEIFAPYCDCREGDYKIAYIDITSEYPTMMANCLFPYGECRRMKPTEKITYENIDNFLNYLNKILYILIIILKLML